MARPRKFRALLLIEEDELGQLHLELAINNAARDANAKEQRCVLHDFNHDLIAFCEGWTGRPVDHVGEE